MGIVGRRAARKPLIQKVLGAALAIVLSISTLISVQSVATASTNFTVPANGLNFTSLLTVENVTSGTVRTYDNVDGNGTVAKVEVTGISNAVSRITGPNWAINWTQFDSDYQLYNTADWTNIVNWRVAYKINTDANFTLSSPVSKATTRMSLTNLRQVADRDTYTFQVKGYDGSGALVGTSPDLSLSTADIADVARHTYSTTTDRLQFLDEKDIDSTVIDGFLRTEVRSGGPGSTTATVKVSFESSSGVARTFTSMRLNSYDLDNSQFLQFNGVSQSDITIGSNVLSVSQTGDRQQFVQASNGSTTVVGSGNAAFSDPLSTSYTTGKVSVMYSNVSTLSFMFGYATGSSNASFEFDFGDRVGAVVAESQPITSPGSSGPQLDVAVIDVNPTNITVASEIVTILGANLDRVDSVWVGGVNVPIMTAGKNRLQIRAPKGLSGLVDLELKSSLNNVLLTKKLNFGGTVASGTRRETLIVGGFAHNSRVLTPRMKARIDRWLAKNSDLSTLTCTGFTSLPRRTTDVALSTNRGKTACAYSESKRAGIKSSVSQGIEDPRPGSNVRRVRLVLTP